jgi:hypothetical protein
VISYTCDRSNDVPRSLLFRRFTSTEVVFRVADLADSDALWHRGVPTMIRSKVLTLDSEVDDHQVAVAAAPGPTLEAVLA